METCIIFFCPRKNSSVRVASMITIELQIFWWFIGTNAVGHRYQVWSDTHAMNEYSFYLGVHVVFFFGGGRLNAKFFKIQQESSVHFLPSFQVKFASKCKNSDNIFFHQLSTKMQQPKGVLNLQTWAANRSSNPVMSEKKGCQNSFLTLTRCFKSIAEGLK